MSGREPPQVIATAPVRRGPPRVRDAGPAPPPAPAAAAQPPPAAAPPPAADARPNGASTPTSLNGVQIRDADGRMLTLGDIGLEQELELIAMVGADRADNQAYMRHIYTIALIKAIDGVPVVVTNQRELRAAIARVGRSGINALYDYFMPREAAEGRGGTDEATAGN